MSDLTAGTLCKRLKGTIYATGISQEALAKEVGMSIFALNKAVNGNRKLTALEASRLCIVLGISADWLLAPEEES